MLHFSAAVIALAFTDLVLSLTNSGIPSSAGAVTTVYTSPVTTYYTATPIPASTGLSNHTTVSYSSSYDPYVSTTTVTVDCGPSSIGSVISASPLPSSPASGNYTTANVTDPSSVFYASGTYSVTVTSYGSYSTDTSNVTRTTTVVNSTPISVSGSYNGNYTTAYSTSVAYPTPISSSGSYNGNYTTAYSTSVANPTSISSGTYGGNYTSYSITVAYPTPVSSATGIYGNDTIIPTATYTITVCAATGGANATLIASASALGGAAFNAQSQSSTNLGLTVIAGKSTALSVLASFIAALML